MEFRGKANLKCLFIIFLVLSSMSQADELDWRTRVIQHMKNSKKCDLAIYSKPKFGQLRDPNVTCITDLTVAVGTINESTGCSLVLYNVNTDTYNPYFINGNSIGIMTKGKMCNEGGFEKLLNMNARGVSVKDRVSTSTQVGEPEVIYFVNKNHKQLIDAEILKNKKEYEANEKRRKQVEAAKEIENQRYQKKLKEQNLKRKKELKKVEELYE